MSSFSPLVTFLILVIGFGALIFVAKSRLKTSFSDLMFTNTKNLTDETFLYHRVKLLENLLAAQSEQGFKRNPDVYLPEFLGSMEPSVATVKAIHSVWSTEYTDILKRRLEGRVFIKTPSDLHSYYFEKLLTEKQDYPVASDTLKRLYLRAQEEDYQKTSFISAYVGKRRAS